MLIYILIFLGLAFFFMMLLALMICASCFNVTGIIKKILSKYTSLSYDRQFQQNQRVQPINTECFICLERVTNEVVATCNHSFCAKCILDYITSKGGSAIDCPACRKKILILFRRFNPVDVDELELKDKICEYNFKHSEEPSLLRSLTEITSVVRYAPMLFSQDGIRYLLTNPRIKFLIMMIVYTLSPFDLIPEAILGPIGLLDDSMVFANIIRQFSGIIINFVSQQSQRNRGRNQGQRRV